MPHIDVNNVSLFYETVGDPDHPPILLIAGLGVQLIDWPDHFVTPLVEAGNYVILYDNRDIGLSTTFDGAPHDPQVVMDSLLKGDEPEVAYTLADMAGDAAGLIEALGFEAAHIVGVSMGAMIAQLTAIMFPNRVRSLTSIMSTTGAPDVGQPLPHALAAILSSAPGSDRDEIIAHNMTCARVWASPGQFDAIRMQKLFEESWDRVGGPQAENTARHICAIVASPPRDEALGSVSVPTLVVHGTADVLIAPSGGERTAASIPGATHLGVEGMGHDLPPSAASDIVHALSELIATSQAAVA